jgi:hypothetical protein
MGPRSLRMSIGMTNRRKSHAGVTYIQARNTRSGVNIDLSKVTTAWEKASHSSTETVDITWEHMAKRSSWIHTWADRLQITIPTSLSMHPLAHPQSSRTRSIAAPSTPSTSCETYQHVRPHEQDHHQHDDPQCHTRRSPALARNRAEMFLGRSRRVEIL